MSTTEGAQVLSSAAGYGLVLGIGFVFAIVMMGLSTLQNRYTSYKIGTSEEFNTASRSVEPGLIASGIVSAWTSAATMLQSSTVTYEYGICGGYYHAAGATLQIFLMAVLAVRVKIIAPNCHTYLEIIQARYGKRTHMVFVAFALVTNMVTSSMLLLGGSAVVNAFTGINIYAANFLIPIGVVIYVILGGLRATFLCDYSHTLILMIIIFYFYFHTYTKAELIGGLDGMYNLLREAGMKRPVADNADGSYLTMKSNYGLVFMMIQMFTGMGSVMLDQGYWQRAIASKPETTVRAYLLGGIAWFAIPITFSTIMGLAAVALADNPTFVFPGGLTAAQTDAGLAAPAGVITLLGKNGAIAMLILLLMAVTSAASSEMIATSSILTFDIYQIHLDPDASPDVLIRISHIMVGIWAIIMSCIACLWNGIGVSLNWLFLFCGTLYTAAVGPVVLSVLWRKQSRIAALSGAIGGLCAGLTCWIAVAITHYGSLTIASTENMYPNLAGSMGSCCSGVLISIAVTLVRPDNDFDWTATKQINTRRGISAGDSHAINDISFASQKVDKDKECQIEQKEPATPIVETDQRIAEVREDTNKLEKLFRTAIWASLILSFVIIIVSGSSYWL
ncbi:Na+/solute symporter [Wolfiporia cocos MD-104 SS10]|uniref:Na+/solute symporter n=1 Tax=Wolfiporia cocos (strain MD-104) TaxID=742152 RepID=A0A2H3JFT4_WOLCO|nr:Na+/solute symporter [Wolfiporia cocos MD-104 SS10]